MSSLQAQKIDSLLAIIHSHAIHDTLKAEAAFDLGFMFLYSDLEEALVYSDTLLEIAKRQDSEHLKNWSYELKAGVARYSNDLPLALKYYEKIMESSMIIKDSSQAFSSIINVSDIYYELFEFEKAISTLGAVEDWEQITRDPIFNYHYSYKLGAAYYTKEDFALALNNLLQGADLLDRNDFSEQSIEDAYILIGSIYEELGETALAVEYYNKSVEYQLNSSLSEYSLGHSYLTLGEYYRNQGKLEEADNFYQKCFQNYRQFPNYDLLASNALSGYVSLLLDFERYQESGLYIDTLITLSERYEDIYNMVSGYSFRGILFNLSKEYRKGALWCKKAYEFALTNDIPYNNRVASCECVRNAYQSLGNYKKADYYATELIAISDSLHSESNLRALAKAELQHSFDKDQIKDSLAHQKDIMYLKKDQELLASENRNISIALFSSLLTLSIVGFLLFQLRRKNQKIISQKRSLEELNNIKDHIFGIIGHDLRKPVIAFSGLSSKVNYLLKKSDFASIKKLGSQIEQNGTSLKQLVDNILNWALSQNDIIPYNPVYANAYHIGQDAIEAISSRAAEKNIRLTNQIHPSQEVYCDSTALFTVLLNLMDNSVKFSNFDDEIILKSEVVNQTLKITVQDSGIGMTEAQLKTLFVLNKDKSRRGTFGEKGTGLGLYITNELIKINKGMLKVKSQLEFGTSIYIILPRIKSV